MLASSLEGPSIPSETNTRRTYLFDADAMGTSVAGDGLPIATITSPMTSESERHDCDWHSTAHLTQLFHSPFAARPLSATVRQYARNDLRTVRLDCRHAGGSVLGGLALRKRHSTGRNCTRLNATPHDATQQTQRYTRKTERGRITRDWADGGLLISMTQLNSGHVTGCGGPKSQTRNATLTATRSNSLERNYKRHTPNFETRLSKNARATEGSSKLAKLGFFASTRTHHRVFREQPE